MDLIALMKEAAITCSICPYCECPSDERIYIGSEKHQTVINEDTTGFIKHQDVDFICV